MGQRLRQPEFRALAQENLLRHLNAALLNQHELKQTLPRWRHSLELGCHLGLIVEIESARSFAEKFGPPRIRGGGVLQRSDPRCKPVRLSCLAILVPAVPRPKSSF